MPKNTIREKYINTHRHDWTMDQEIDFFLAEFDSLLAEKEREVLQVMNEEHEYDECSAHGEGQLCCLDEEHERAKRIIQILKK